MTNAAVKVSDVYEIRAALARGYSIYDLPLRVAYYTRVSTRKEDQLHSLGNQTDYFENYIKDQKNWTFVGGYVDEGITGTSVKKREDFLRMLDDGKKKRFDLLLTKEVSRFARNTLDSIQYTRQLLFAGVGVFFQNDNINTLEPDSELRLTIMASMAQEESRKISSRTKFGFKRSVENGVVLGSNRIWGYQKDKGKLVIVEKEAEIVRFIFQRYAEGFGFYSIAQQLKQRGVKNSNGKDFGYSTINNIIKNPKYKGYYCGNKTTKLDMLSNLVKTFDQDEWVLWRDDSGEIVPAIVSEELWDRCQRIREDRNEKIETEKTSYQNKYPYSGKIKCGKHGRSFWHSIYKYASGNKVVWQCGEYRRHGLEGCDAPVIYSHEIDHALRLILEEMYQGREAILDRLIGLYGELLEEPEDQSACLQAREKIDLLEKKKEKLLELALEGHVTNQEFEKRNNALNIELEKHEKTLADTERKKKDAQSQIDPMVEVRRWLEQKVNFQNADSDVLARFVEAVYVDGSRGSNTISLKFILKTGIELPAIFQRKKGQKGNMRLEQTMHMIRVDIQTDVTLYKMHSFQIHFQKQKGNDYSEKYNALFDVELLLVA